MILFLLLLIPFGFLVGLFVYTGSYENFKIYTTTLPVLIGKPLELTCVSLLFLSMGVLSLLVCSTKECLTLFSNWLKQLKKYLAKNNS